VANFTHLPLYLWRKGLQFAMDKSLSLTTGLDTVEKREIS
jgi:hypothetical protein